MISQVICLCHVFSQENDVQGASKEREKSERLFVDLHALINLVLLRMLKEHGIGLDEARKAQDILRKLTNKKQDLGKKGGVVVV